MADPRDEAEKAADDRRQAAGWFWLSCARSEGVEFVRDPGKAVSWRIDYPSNMVPSLKRELEQQIGAHWQEIQKLL